MKGRSVTASQKRFHDMLCRHIGCVACRTHGVFNDYVVVHHLEGRTKADAHWLVLPLCASHHQDDGSGAIAVHPYKARFEAEYGRQADLLRECVQALIDLGFAVPAEAIRVAGLIHQESK